MLASCGASWALQVLLRSLLNALGSLLGRFGRLLDDFWSTSGRFWYQKAPQKEAWEGSKVMFFEDRVFSRNQGKHKSKSTFRHRTLIHSRLQNRSEIEVVSIFTLGCSCGSLGTLLGSSWGVLVLGGSWGTFGSQKRPKRSEQ